VRPWAGGDADSLSEMLEGLRATFGIDPEVPFAKLPKRHRDLILNGAPGQRSSAPRKGAASLDPFGADFEGVLPNLRRRFEEGAWADQETLEPYRSLQVCGACEGDRLRPESRAVRVKGHRLSDFTQIPLSRALPLVESLELTERETLIAGRVLKEIRDRLRFLVDVGVGYLTLARSAATLSGGEGQRIRLA